MPESGAFEIGRRKPKMSVVGVDRKRATVGRSDAFDPLLTYKGIRRWVLFREWKFFDANCGARRRVWRTVPIAIKSHVGERSEGRLAQGGPDHKAADHANDDPEGHSISGHVLISLAGWRNLNCR